MKQQIKKLEKEIREREEALKKELDPFIRATLKFGIKIKTEELEDCKNLYDLEQQIKAL